MKRRGFTFPEVLITGTVFALLILIGTLLLSLERARTRDAIRIGHMTRVAGLFGLLYAQEGSYAAATTGCSHVGQPVSACTFTQALGGADDLTDPGRFSYRVVRVPNREDFAIEFRLERTYGALPAGRHVLTKQGIQ